MITANTKSVNVARTALLEKLEENLALHKKDFKEAVLGYKVKLLVDLQKAIIDVNSTEPENLNQLDGVSFHYPQNYENEYIEIIEMLKMSVDEIINLDARSFQNYVRNQWSWSSSFNNSTTVLKSFAAAAKLI